MSKPKLKNVIQDLEKLRQRYIKKYGKEPVVWMMSEDDGKTDVELCLGVVRDGMVTKSLGGDMAGRISMGMW
jgi:hypothetical protein